MRQKGCENSSTWYAAGASCFVWISNVCRTCVGSYWYVFIFVYVFNIYVYVLYDTEKGRGK